MLLVRHLNLSYLDLVVAVVALERCVKGSNEPRGLFCRHAMRRTFLGCCLIARKVNSDAPTARIRSDGLHIHAPSSPLLLAGRSLRPPSVGPSPLWPLLSIIAYRPRRSHGRVAILTPGPPVSAVRHRHQEVLGAAAGHLHRAHVRGVRRHRVPGAAARSLAPPSPLASLSFSRVAPPPIIGPTPAPPHTVVLAACRCL